MLKELLGSKGYGRLSISPDGEYCLSAGEETMLWDLRSATLIERIRGDTFSSDISIGPRGQLALISVGNTIQLWKLPSRRELSMGDAASTNKKRSKKSPRSPTTHPSKSASGRDDRPQ